MSSTNTDQLINEQEKLFRKELRSKALEIEKARVALAAHKSWYDQNLVQTVYNSVVEGSSLNRQAIEASVTIGEGNLNPNIGERFTGDVDKIMEDRPSGIGAAFAWATRKLSANKTAFLDILKTKGQVLVDQAAEELEDLQEQLSQLQNNKWTQIEQASNYYYELVNAITAQDIQAILEAVSTSDTQAIAPSVKRDLFLKPLNQYDNALLAIEDTDLDDPKQEGEIVATILNSFGDDFEALQVIQSNIPKIKDEAVRNRYQAYANAFTGILFPISETSAINIWRYGRAEFGTASRYIDGKWTDFPALVLADSHGKETSFTMNEAQAQTFLDALAERPTHIATGTGSVVNVNAYGRAEFGTASRYIDGKWTDFPALVLADSHGNETSFTMNEAQAKDFIRRYRQLGQRLGIIQSYAADRNELIYGLNEARAWEDSYRSSHQDTSGLMDYLPIIIVGAIVLMDNNEVHVNDLSMDGDLGVGLNQDFADASLAYSIEYSLGDMGIDTFQADFNTTMNDFGSGFDTSGFDTGGSSFDTSSLFDSGSVISGFDGGSIFGL